MSWVDYHNILRDKFAENNKIVSVSKKHSVENDGYPYATIEPKDGKEEYHTTADNEMAYVYEAVVHQEMEKVGSEKAIEILEEIADDIRQRLYDDYMLGNTCRIVTPTAIEWGEYVEAGGWVKYILFEITIKKIIQ